MNESASGEVLFHDIIEEDGSRRFVVKTDEDEYSCGAVIIAVGTEPRRLSEKQERDAGKRPIS